MKTASFYLDELTLNLLSLMAVEEDRSQSAVIRRLVRDAAMRRSELDTMSAILSHSLKNPEPASEGATISEV